MQALDLYRLAPVAAVPSREHQTAVDVAAALLVELRHALLPDHGGLAVLLHGHGGRHSTDVAVVGADRGVGP